MNAFSIGDKNITMQNYDLWLEQLNTTDPEKVADLQLRTCDLQTFLDQVCTLNVMFSK